MLPQAEAGVEQASSKRVGSGTAGNYPTQAEFKRCPHLISRCLAHLLGELVYSIVRYQDAHFKHQSPHDGLYMAGTRS